eukprot:5655572-Amphidinium_carterae.1
MQIFLPLPCCLQQLLGGQGLVHVPCKCNLDQQLGTDIQSEANIRMLLLQAVSDSRSLHHLVPHVEAIAPCANWRPEMRHFISLHLEMERCSNQSR